MTLLASCVQNGIQTVMYLVGMAASTIMPLLCMVACTIVAGEKFELGLPDGLLDEHEAVRLVFEHSPFVISWWLVWNYTCSF